MNHNFSLISILSALSLSASADFTSSVQQIYNIEDAEGNPEIIYHQLVSDGDLNGTVDMEPIQGESIRLLLEAIQTTEVDGETETIAHHIDEVQLGHYTPTATITVNADDYVSGRYRTPITREYSVSVVVDGLSSDENLQDAAKEVHFYHAKEIFGADDEASTFVTPTDPTAVRSTNITPYSYHDGISLIKLADPSVHGYETFSAVTLPDFGFPDTSTLDEKVIEICPETTATMNGFEEGKLYSSLPTFEYSIQNVYPGNGSAGQSILVVENGSTVDGPKYGILCYSGDKITNHTSKDLLDYSVYSQYTLGYTSPKSVPENHDEFVTTSTVNDYITGLGEDTYTVEIYQYTGLGGSGIEILSSVTVDYDPDIEINAHIGSSE